MRSADEWFELYGESHQNPTNKLIHWICIPVIVLSLLGLLQSLPFPWSDGIWLHWGTVFAAASLLFYILLSPTVMVGMVIVGGSCLAINGLIAQAGLPLLQISIGIFIVAWIFQFIGHKIEGKKPSFFEDLQFLLVGPAWLIQFIYRRVGIPV